MFGFVFVFLLSTLHTDRECITIMNKIRVHKINKKYACVNKYAYNNYALNVKLFGYFTLLLFPA